MTRLPWLLSFDSSSSSLSIHLWKRLLSPTTNPFLPSAGSIKPEAELFFENGSLGGFFFCIGKNASISSLDQQLRAPRGEKGMHEERRQYRQLKKSQRQQEKMGLVSASRGRSISCVCDGFGCRQGRLKEKGGKNPLPSLAISGVYIDSNFSFLSD